MLLSLEAGGFLHTEVREARGCWSVGLVHRKRNEPPQINPERDLGYLPHRFEVGDVDAMMKANVGGARCLRKHDRFVAYSEQSSEHHAPSSLLLVVRPGAPSSFLPLVAMPLAPSSYKHIAYICNTMLQ